MSPAAPASVGEGQSSSLHGVGGTPVMAHPGGPAVCPPPSGGPAPSPGAPCRGAGCRAVSRRAVDCSFVSRADDATSRARRQCTPGGTRAYLRLCTYGGVQLATEITSEPGCCAFGLPLGCIPP